MGVLILLGLLCPVIMVTQSVPNKGEWREVITAQGPVRGYKDPDEEIYVFHNIPYATAPTGVNKFKAPLPPPVWVTPYNATDRGIICPQYNVAPDLYKNLKMQEQCLIANVYLPITKKRNLSVLIIIHGGEFKIGYGDFLKDKHLMRSKNLIVVTFNYRLGIHGFLCLGTDHVPGNAGIKDQLALLRWVQLNIASFGGNAKDVTLSGYSVGSSSADLLMITKSHEDLFHKVIIESGSSLTVFAIQEDPLQNAKEYARKLNFTDTENIFALEKFYNTLSYDVMTSDPFEARPDSSILFCPCLEHNKGNKAFLTEPPLTLIKRGNYKKLPMLYGFTNMEGLIRIPLFDTWKDRMNENFSEFLPADLKFTNNEEKEAVANKVKTFYFGDQPVGTDNILRYVDYFSDVNFFYSSLKAVHLYAKAGHTNVYLYEYSFVDKDIPVVPYTNVRGANHLAETQAISDGKNVTYFLEDIIRV